MMRTMSGAKNNKTKHAKPQRLAILQARKRTARERHTMNNLPLNKSMMWHHALAAAVYMHDLTGFDLLYDALCAEHEPPVSEDDVAATIRVARNAGMWTGKRGKVRGDFAYAGFGWGVAVYKGLPYPVRTGVVLGVPLADTPTKNVEWMLQSWAQNEHPIRQLLLNNLQKTFSD